MQSRGDSPNGKFATFTLASWSDALHRALPFSSRVASSLRIFVAEYCYTCRSQVSLQTWNSAARPSLLPQGARTLNDPHAAGTTSLVTADHLEICGPAPPPASSRDKIEPSA